MSISCTLLLLFTSNFCFTPTTAERSHKSKFGGGPRQIGELKSEPVRCYRTASSYGIIASVSRLVEEAIQQPIGRLKQKENVIYYWMDAV